MIKREVYSHNKLRKWNYPALIKAQSYENLFIDGQTNVYGRFCFVSKLLNSDNISSDFMINRNLRLNIMDINFGSTAFRLRH